MAYMEEIDVGDRVSVTDLRTGKRHEGTVEKLVPDVTRGFYSVVYIRLDSGAFIGVSPGRVTLQVGEES